MRKLAVSVSLVAMLGLAGCASTFLVTSEHFAGITETKAEVVPTPTYLKEGSTLKSVAVKAPDNCASKGVGELTGETRSQNTVLSTACGVEISEVERELAKRGYKVISWNILARHMASNNLNALEAAQTLGAQVLFQINSLEQTIVRPGSDARWTRSYFKSNKYADPVKPAILKQEKRSLIAGYIEPKEKRVNADRLAVTMDATAVNLGTGEAIWFYRWTHIVSKPEADSVRALLQCNNKLCVELDSKEHAKQAGNERASTDSIAVSTQQQSASATQAAYYKLMVESVADMIRNFAGA